MKIVYIVAGAGGMYCGACLQSNTLALAVQRAGHEVLLAPAYTPLLTEEEGVPAGRMVFGGVNVYLQQKWSLFRHTPWLFDRLLDRPAILGWLAKRSSSTQPEGLGELTVSMLRGEEGRQRKELEKLLDWLDQQPRPDVVHLSTAMLAGMARQIVRQLGIPVVATLSGEDIFLERIPQPHYEESRQTLRERCADLTAMIALNGYYADFSARYLAVPPDRIHVIPPGLNLAGHRLPSDPRPGECAKPGPGAVTIGYLARICPEKGLHLLAEAFALLARDDGLPPTRLVAAGQLGNSDRPYLAAIEARLAEQGLADRFQYAGSLDRAEKIALLQSFDLMSVPTVYPESKGIYVFEAWANGVPVVLPAHGAFPEMIADTGGGLLCQPNDPASLADALRQTILDPQRAADWGHQAQQAVHHRYHADRMAQQTIALYERVVVSGQWTVVRK